ncbi:MAG: NUDIX hydrolase [Hyphomonas sp.]
MSGEKPVPAVGTVCFRGEDVLLIRRGTKPLAGNWSIPGGKIEFGERTEAAALRELKEETGVTARLIGLVDVVDAIFTSRTSGETARHYVLFDFAAVWEAGEPVAGDDAAHAEWVDPERLATLDLWDETRRIIDAARALAMAQSAS